VVETREDALAFIGRSPKTMDRGVREVGSGEGAMHSPGSTPPHRFDEPNGAPLRARASSSGVIGEPIDVERTAHGTRPAPCFDRTVLRVFGFCGFGGRAKMGTMLVFDASKHDGTTTELGERLEVVTDRVMGGVSSAEARVEPVGGRRALRLLGDVRLENNGGFVQLATDLRVDASAFSHLRLDVIGPAERYGCHLRTRDVRRPWQSYRQSFEVIPTWTTVDLPLQHFTPHRTETAFDPSKLRRLGLVAIGRAFRADLAVARIELC